AGAAHEKVHLRDSHHNPSKLAWDHTPSFVNPPNLEEYSQEFFIRKPLPTLKKDAE
ncbi:4649_t:CDS:1, partial [Dentiscutata erythropus]